jgi:hypothetical protein
MSNLSPVDDGRQKKMMFGNNALLQTNSLNLIKTHEHRVTRMQLQEECDASSACAARRSAGVLGTGIVKIHCLSAVASLKNVIGIFLECVLVWISIPFSLPVRGLKNTVVRKHLISELTSSK